jgi:Bacterial capsule synthesis protein PGA_cap
MVSAGALVVALGVVSVRAALPTAVAPTSTTVAVTTSTVPAITISAVGDTELGNTPDVPADPTAWFAPVAKQLVGDIVFGNLEGTMATSGTSKCGTSSTNCYAFRVPPSMAAVYAHEGFNVLNSANNHAWDYGSAGVSETSTALAKAGITQAGLPGQIGLRHVGSTTVAFVDFAPYYNTNQLLSPSAIASLLATAKAEANVVVAYFHTGAEGPAADHVTRQTETFYGENRGNPYQVAHFAIDHGANLVLASGPHVLRGMQFYKGDLIAYSLGDFINFHNFATVGDLALTGVLHVTLSATGTFQSASFSSDEILPNGQVVPDPAGRAGAFITTLSHQDFAGESPVTIAPGSTGEISFAP